MEEERDDEGEEEEEEEECGQTCKFVMSNSKTSRSLVHRFFTWRRGGVRG